MPAPLVTGTNFFFRGKLLGLPLRHRLSAPPRVENVLRNLGFYDIRFAGAPGDFRNGRKAVGFFCTKGAREAARVLLFATK